MTKVYNPDTDSWSTETATRHEKVSTVMGLLAAAGATFEVVNGELHVPDAQDTTGYQFTQP